MSAATKEMTTATIPSNEAMIEALAEAYGDGAIVTRENIQDVCNRHNYVFPAWLVTESNRISRGKYRLPSRRVSTSVETITSPEGKPVMVVGAPLSERFVPEPLDGYVKFGNHEKLEKIIASHKFFPVYISGLSGCGKTTEILQICAESDRECFRVNITAETDEDDLLGGFRIVNGNMQFNYGPVVEAMRRGAILVLDEADLASTKIMCLQPVLEGRAIYLKKIGQTIRPAKGFNIIATANTKGQGGGESGGRFIGTGVLNEAFLDRFPCTLDQDYPSANAESRILRAVFERNGQSGPEIESFISHLVTWAEVVRKTYFENGIDEVVSTRRMVYIAEAYSINPDREEALNMMLARFTESTRQALSSLYAKVDATIQGVPSAPNVSSVMIPEGEIPF